MPGRKDLRILDLGCGTGLAGLAFKSCAGYLAGIDLAPAMIAKARARGIYDRLDGRRSGNRAGANRPAFDRDPWRRTRWSIWVISAPVFAGAARRLAPDGYFLFTTEAKEGDGFELGPKRRWRHSEAYIRAIRN